MKIVFDYDALLYAAGGVGENRYVKVVHKQSGDEHKFKNRTEFWGHHKTKSGGWLADWNKDNPNNQRSPGEFDIRDVQEAEPVEYCLRTLKMLIDRATKLIGASSYHGYVGSGPSFREDISTIVKYKGNRDGALRPLHIDAMKDYLCQHHACERITGIEADDACSIDSYSAWKAQKRGAEPLVLVCADKDYRGIDGNLLWSKQITIGDATIDSHSGFGSLWLDLGTNKVLGRGRLWLYHQIMSGDQADNYFANSASPEVRWGEKASYNLLSACKTDKEAFEQLVAGYKKLYPTKKKVAGWRGDLIEVDAAYMLEENFQLARMLRWVGDKVSIVEVLKNHGITI